MQNMLLQFAENTRLIVRQALSSTCGTCKLHSAETATKYTKNTQLFVSK